jgi:hypothetical protein
MVLMSWLISGVEVYKSIKVVMSLECQCDREIRRLVMV